MYSMLKIKLKTIFICFFIIFFLGLLIIFPSYAANGVKNGLNYTANILIPSLFPFMVISSLAIRSQFSDVIGRPFEKITKTFFGLPKVCSSAIILSLIGGFPIGAKCIKILYDEQKININQAQHMIMFCVCPGPAFLITAIGTIMLKNIVLGIILYISQIISCLILGIISKFINCNNTKNLTLPPKNMSQKTNFISSFILSCSDGSKAIIQMTALVVMFSIILNVFDKSGFINFCSNIISKFGIEKRFSDTIIYVVFEVTGACSKICENTLPLFLISFAVGFGGLCIHFQIFDILNGIPIKKLLFFAFRFLNAVFSSIITYIICIFYTPLAETFATLNTTENIFSSSSIFGSLALIFMSILFLFSLKQTISLRNSS